MFSNAEIEKMVTENLWAVGFVAKREGLHHPDFLQHLTIILWKCAKRFKPELGGKLSSFFIGSTIHTARNWRYELAKEHAKKILPLDDEIAKKTPEKSQQVLPDLSALTARELYIIRNRYGFDAEKSQEEIGKELNCSKQNIQRIEKLALKKLSQAAMA